MLMDIKSNSDLFNRICGTIIFNLFCKTVALSVLFTLFEKERNNESLTGPFTHDINHIRLNLTKLFYLVSTSYRAFYLFFLGR